MNQFESSVKLLSKSDAVLDVLSLYFSGDEAMALELLNASSPERTLIEADFEVAVNSLIVPSPKNALAITVIK